MSAKDQVLQLVDYFKKEPQLKDKTDAMGDGLLLGANLADEANERSKDATETTLAVQEKYKEQILAQDLNPNKDPELVDLRNGEQTAGERISKFEQKTNIQLFQIAYYLEDFWKNVYADWSPAFEDAITTISNNGGGSLILGQGKIYKGNFVLNKPDVKVFGGGTIEGTLKLDIDLVDNIQKSLNAKVHDIKFKYDGIHDYAIEVYRARDINIKDCYFPEDISKGIVFKEIPTYNQMTARAMFENNDFNGDYSFYCDHETLFFPLADIHWNNNMSKNKISNIHAVGVDGISFSGSTMFLPGSHKMDASKKHNIYLRRSMWFTIDSSNHLFEAGLESILLDQTQNPVIDGVSIAWPGQRIPSDAIRIKNGDHEGSHFVMGSITGANIIFPTRHGISIEDNSGGTVVTGNKVKSAGYSGYYYGTDDLSAIEHYGINTDATTRDLLVTGNNTRDNKNNLLGQTNYFADNFDVDQNVVRKNRVLTLSTIDSVISVKGRETINLNQPSAVSVTGLTDGYDGQEITLVAFNGNTKLKTSAAYLIGRLDVQMTVGSIIKLRYSSGNWYEVGSNINRNRVTSGPTNSRPTTRMQIADLHYDTSLNKPTWWSGLAWKDANGTTV